MCKVIYTVGVHILSDTIPTCIYTYVGYLGDIIIQSRFDTTNLVLAFQATRKTGKTARPDLSCAEEY